jgi:hypothetical protein
MVVPTAKQQRMSLSSLFGSPIEERPEPVVTNGRIGMKSFLLNAFEKRTLVTTGDVFPVSFDHYEFHR